MRNIELKARLHDRAAAIRACENLAAVAQGDLWQRDTYFKVAEGRFKLRELEPGDDYLVFYRRSDVAGVKGCDYMLEPARPSIRDVLSQALGTLAVVEKVRTLYLWHNVRIHLDRVVELGDFIEFEAVLDASHDDADGFAKLEVLQEAFAIEAGDIEPGSYLDLTLARTLISPWTSIFCNAEEGADLASGATVPPPPYPPPPYPPPAPLATAAGLMRSIFQGTRFACTNTSRWLSGAVELMKHTHWPSRHS